MLDAFPTLEPIKLHGPRRVLLLGEILVFALPCYLVFAVCIPLAVLGLLVFFEMAIDALSRPAAIHDLRDFAPFAIASMMAFAGFPAMWMFAKLLFLLFRGRMSSAAATARLTKALKWAVVPLVGLTLLMIWISSGLDFQSPGRFEETLLNIVLDAYATGLPLLIPAFHLKHILGSAKKSA